MKKSMSVLISMILLLTLALTGCGKPSKEECEQFVFEGKLKEFQEGECAQTLMEDFQF